ncbi:MAG TPA: hypothetical protein VMN36_19300 [Verrucomicrobiales bacterium]|nr:hypothetical protein [Verrucomicrobiales bacterium]
MKTSRLFPSWPFCLSLVLWTFLAGFSRAAGQTEGNPSRSEVRDWERLHRLVQPAEGESPWRKIAWLTDITSARKRAAEEDKPLVIFTAADGSPLGRT